MSTRILSPSEPLTWRIRATATRCVAIAVVAGLTVSACSSNAAALCDPAVTEELHPDSGVHVIAGATVNWSDNTPTSGPHYSLAPRTGALDAQVDPAEQVTALEAGMIVIQYSPDLDAAVAETVRSLADSDVLTAPSSDLDSEVVATAWRTRLRCRGADAAQLRAFVRDHAGRAPSHE